MAAFWRFLGKLKRAVVGYLDNHLEKAGIAPEIAGTLLTRSTQDREILTYVIGTGKLPVLCVAGIHGNEVGTIRLVESLINWLYYEKPFPQLTIHLIPCLNPDGNALARQHPDYWNGGKIGRFNGRGVDLNRNFPTSSFQKHSVWSHGKNYSDSTEVYCGETPLSEPETQALIAYITEHGIKTIMVFHNAGADVTAASNEKSQKYAAAFSKASGYRLTTEESWKEMGQTGTMKEWAEMKDYCYLEVEGAKRWGADEEMQRKGTEAVLQLLDSEAAAMKS